ncbi:MAG: T9SS type A sorting domain-containing protein, partial [Bacteroidota bacterium]
STVSTVQFGTNVDPQGNTRDLFMDIYQPEGDTVSRRPVIVLAYGGAFVAGQRGDMEPFARIFAHSGYVAVSIDYRLLEPSIINIPDSLDFLDVAFKAVGDMKASIRELRKSVDEGNPYRIDPNMIFVGGVSAGAITAIQTAYVTPEDDIPDYVMNVIDANGGFEGNTGDSLNQTYTSEVNGVVNGSGAVYLPHWIDEGEVPITSYHGTEDRVVPYNFGIATLSFGIFDLMVVSLNGSGNIQTRANEVGIPNILETVEGGEHSNIYTDSIYQTNLNTFIANSASFLESIVCNTISSNKNEIVELDIDVFPNPVKDVIQIRINEAMDEDFSILLVDVMGRTVVQYDANKFEQDITLANQGWPSGMYFLNIQNSKGRSTTSLIVN